MVILAYVLDQNCHRCRGGDQPSLEDGLVQGVRNEETHNARSYQGTIGGGLNDDEIAYVESMRPSPQNNGARNFRSYFSSNNTSHQTTLLPSD